MRKKYLLPAEPPVFKLKAIGWWCPKCKSFIKKKWGICDCCAGELDNKDWERAYICE